MSKYEKYWGKILKIIENNSDNDNPIKVWNNILKNELSVKVIIENRKFVKKTVSDHYDFRYNSILNYINNEKPSAFIEFGSGWGRNIYYLLNKNTTNLIDYYGLEYTNSGIKCSKKLSKYYTDYNLLFKNFDYKEKTIPIEKRYDHILACTIHSIEQITMIDKEFFYNLFKIADKITCIHIEPIGWQITDDCLGNKLNKISKNRHYYNRNLYNTLLELEKEEKIKILEKKVDFCGFDLDNCGTCVKWEKI